MRWRYADRDYPPGHTECCRCGRPLEYGPEHQSAAGRQTVDRELPANGGEKSARIDLGLALLHAQRLPSVPYTLDEIAAWCGCTDTYIRMIERRALHKLRRRVGVLREFLPDY